MKSCALHSNCDTGEPKRQEIYLAAYSPPVVLELHDDGSVTWRAGEPEPEPEPEPAERGTWRWPQP